ncbi:XRE family transcriptional regulator [Nitrospira sp.]|nr:XRE family transcriptional regulator [Nitrospira sp.]
MDSIGEFFKQVRETKGLSVEEVALKTRIRADFVRAIEEGNYAKLPDQVFARGFVRSYARSLGLDEEDAIQRFVQSAGSYYDKQNERERLRQKQEEEDRRKRSSRKAVGFAIAVALGVLVILLTRQQSGQLLKRASQDFTPPTKAAATARTGKDVASAGAQSPGESDALAEEVNSAPLPPTKPHAAAAPVESSAPQTPIQSAPSAQTGGGTEGPLAGLSVDGPSSGDPLLLDLEAVELSWVVVQIDGGSPVEALMRPGERAQWKAMDQFALTLGNAGGVKAELNGKPQKPFGPSGKVVRDVILKRDS